MDSRPVRFLLIEDDDGHADLIRLALEENHVVNTVERVADGAAALACLKREPPYEESAEPDVVLLDLRLPKVDGHEVLQFIKNSPRLRTIPVVVLTTSAAEADRSRAYCNHANSYLVKPVDFEKFHRMIKDLNLYWSAWNAPPPPILQIPCQRSKPGVT